MMRKFFGNYSTPCLVVLWSFAEFRGAGELEMAKRAPESIQSSEGRSSQPARRRMKLLLNDVDFDKLELVLDFSSYPISSL